MRVFDAQAGDRTKRRNQIIMAIHGTADKFSIGIAFD
jgi:hypothetical protein